MTKILELLDQQLKRTMINILQVLMDKVDNMPEHMGKVNGRMEM